jgi:hypothetical protein
MNKERENLTDRLDDFIGVIKANIRQTKNQTKIIEQEILAYKRLRERIKKEQLLLQEASHVTKQIKDSSNLVQIIHIMKKGKQ